MTRVFRRGELKHAILDALADIEPANGYTIMQALADAVGAGWRPSPGAIYPALLGLQDAGLIAGLDDGTGSTAYSLTEHGRDLRAEVAGNLVAVAARAREVAATPTLGSLVDEFAAGVAGRAVRLDPPAVDVVRRILATATAELATITDKETNDG